MWTDGAIQFCVAPPPPTGDSGRGASMCQPSKVTDDWVTKGCHIHVDGVELNIYTNHLGGIDFRAVFSATPDNRVKQAIKKAREVCLPDPATRRSWLHKLNSARVYMLSYEGTLSDLARGRMLDFKFIRIAIERWGAEHGDA
jgi:hypothetical protein